MGTAQLIPHQEAPCHASSQRPTRWPSPWAPASFKLTSGRVSYAVLSFGGVLGLGDKLFAVPWAALSLDTANKRFTLNVPNEALKNAPGFDKDHWPPMSEKTWAGGVHKFYGTPFSQN